MFHLREMKQQQCDVLIIGAGLTGLYLAYLLKQEGKKVQVVEARDRIGGRIFTLYEEGKAPQEMGATWLGRKHKALTNVLQELDIKVFEQALGGTAIYEPISTSPPQIVQLPANSDPSFRIAGGTSQVINRLASFLDTGTIQLKQTVGESIKIGLTYRTPFWRTKGSSGTIMSNVGPIPEMYDHANYEDDAYALIGFLNGSYHGVSRDQRIELIINQLKKYYGDQVLNYLSYDEVVWSKERFTHASYANYMFPHQNNGHKIYRQPFLNGKLHVAGTETADEHAGYMDGAIRSAQYVSREITTL